MSKYDLLNPMQKDAVLSAEGPLLILAGAGSGKTRVLTHRIAYLIEEKHVDPWNIMAITFTNKAAKEMRERVDSLIGEGGQQVWVSTFHSSCVRILRKYCDKMGYDRYFTIYDTDDSKKIVRECMKQLNIDPKQYKESALLSAINSAKNDLIPPHLYTMTTKGDFRKEIYAKVYSLYQEKLKKCNALDFGDLLVKTVELFVEHPEVLKAYQNQFKYIMVDEYQDTNGVQFELINLLAKEHHNLCVVGDDDQSIYKFRGADISNILDFEKTYPKAKVIKLEQNYRSTGNILEAANQVIRNNVGRKSKKLWTEKEDGEKIAFKRLPSEKEEALYVAEHIMKGVEADKSYKDYALLYRTNAQSRILEESLVRFNIPYKIVGGTSFYQRKEIKDVLAYLKVIANGTDNLAVKRIINVPRRGIGDTTIDKLHQYAMKNDMSFFKALSEVSFIPDLSRAEKKITDFFQMMVSFRNQLETISLVELLHEVLEKTSYRKELTLEDTDEAKDRLSNINELVSKLTDYETNEEEPSLNGFLEEVSLIADIDQYDENNDFVVLMTLHSAKGLEFPYVFLTGLEEGLFPSFMTISSGSDEDLEEERRLCYVGITRAEKKLWITCASSRMINGQTMANPASRFIREIPMDIIEKEEMVTSKAVNNAPFSYARKNNSFFTNQPYQISKPAKMALPIHESATIDYGIGDLVLHKQFGMGKVMNIEHGGKDYQVTVDFPSVGVKKLFAGLAALKKSQ
ncbi:MAG: DNA helicase PcrA [Firmicutes bacterium HGW-Firmicutes-1]|jgi:DNA helicase-2/ATP-dependent DNA helicase PcrA|nr:MAG: DNA helicase PcrA [Firmicutes bacterium HGW-Firmicutes-1]